MKIDYDYGNIKISLKNLDKIFFNLNNYILILIINLL